MWVSLLKVLKSSAAKKAVKVHVSPYSPQMSMAFFIFASYLLTTHTKHFGNFQSEMIEILHISKKEKERIIFGLIFHSGQETDLL